MASRFSWLRVGLVFSVACLTGPAAVANGQSTSLTSCQAARHHNGGMLPDFRALARKSLQAGETYSPPTEQFRRDARRQLYHALKQLRSRYVNHPDIWKRWVSKLHWNLVTEFQNDDLNIDITKWKPMTDALESKYVRQLRLPEFAAVHSALLHWLRVIAAFQHDNAEAFHRKYMGQLADALAAPNEMKSRQHLSRALVWLRSVGQFESLRWAVLCHFSHNNLRVALSERLLDRVLLDEIPRQVDDTRGVGEWSNGAYISGSTTTRGNMSIDVRPNARRAQIDLVFTGQVMSDVLATASQRGLFKTRTYSIPMAFWTNLEGRKPVFLSPNGVGSTNARAVARTQSSVSNQVYSNALLGNNVAKRAVLNGQPQARSQVSQTAVDVLSARLDREARAPLARAQKDFASGFLDLKNEGNLDPAHTAYSSSDSDVFIDILQMQADQLGAPNLVPGFGGSSDVRLAIHESFATNYSSAFNSGEEVTYKDVAISMADIFGQVPPELDTGSPAVRVWSMTFADDLGVQFKFEPAKLTLCFDVVQFSIRRVNKDAGFKACGVYTWTFANHEVSFQRLGDPSFALVGDVDESTANFIERKARALFLLSFKWDRNITLPPDWRKLGKLQLSSFESKAGWLSFGYNLR